MRLLLSKECLLTPILISAALHVTISCKARTQTTDLKSEESVDPHYSNSDPRQVFETVHLQLRLSDQTRRLISENKSLILDKFATISQSNEDTVRELKVTPSSSAFQDAMDRAVKFTQSSMQSMNHEMADLCQYLKPEKAAECGQKKDEIDGKIESIIQASQDKLAAIGRDPLLWIHRYLGLDATDGKDDVNVSALTLDRAQYFAAADNDTAFALTEPGGDLISFTLDKLAQGNIVIWGLTLFGTGALVYGAGILVMLGSGGVLSPIGWFVHCVGAAIITIGVVLLYYDILR